MKVAFRCDGDSRVGAGHVARSLQIAAAFRRAGHEAELVGRYEGLAADLVAAAGLRVSPPGLGPAGVGEDPDAAVVDSYEIDPAELSALAEARPVAGLWDYGPPPPLSVLVHYHPCDLPADPDRATVLEGPAYAPVAPAFVAARRQRGLERALVAIGGSGTGTELIGPAVEALESLGGVEVTVAGAGGDREPGLAERVAWADVAVSAAGGTAYELACAGVPAVVVPIAANQLPVVRGLAEAGAVRGVDTSGAEGAGHLREQVAALGDEAVRRRLSARGPATVDGAGAARIRAALLEVFAGRPPPTVLRFRPAQPEDAPQLFAWRSDPAVRAASRSTAPVEWEGHTAWLDRTLADPARTLWLIERDGAGAGSVRFDRAGDRADISVSLGSDHRGAGLGTQAIGEATELYLAAHPDIAVVEAHVRTVNAGSLAAFERAAYRTARTRGEMAILTASAPSA